MSNRVVHVAVGVIKNQDNEVLISKRADNVHQGGLWEFPGGRIELDEEPAAAARRAADAIRHEALLPGKTQHHDIGVNRIPQQGFGSGIGVKCGQIVNAATKKNNFRTRAHRHRVTATAGEAVLQR